ncbi:MAG: tetratricopeptide repeat protein [Hyphomicrobiales bacterium]|nr:tetratricopeptide repeat protein [Hyphomicrobiales bacterium]
MHSMFIPLRVIRCWLYVLVVGISLTGCQSAEEKAQSHYENGQKLVEKQQLVKAKLEFRNALKLNKDHTPALFSLAKIEFEQQKFAGAFKKFVAVADADPKHIDARVNASQIMLLAGRQAEALKYADEAYAIDSDNLSVLAIKGSIAIRQKSYNEALGFANKALEIDPNNTEAIILLAAERMASSDPKGALAYLDKNALDNESNIGLQLIRLRILESMNDSEGVEQIIIRLSELLPDNIEVQNNLAKWYLRAGKIDAAEQVVRQFQQSHPTDEKAGFNLIVFLREQRSNEKAEEELLLLIKKSGSETLNYQLALAELIFARGGNQEGEDLLNQLISGLSETDDKAKAQLLLARQLVRTGKPDDALALAEIVLSKDAKNVDALLIRATISTIRNDYTAAADDLRLALSEEPRSVNILQAIAKVYERSGKIELAEENLTKAVIIEQFEPKSGLNLAQFLLRYGKSKRAETVLKEILEKTPSDEAALKRLARVRLGQGNWLGANEVATSLERLGEGNKVLVDRIRARSLAGQNKFDESISVLQGSLERTPDDKTPVVDLFRLYVKTQKYDAAEELLKSSLRSDENNVLTYIRLASLYRLQKRIDEAEVLLKTAVEKDVSSIKGLYALSQFYLKEGRNAEAESTVRKGLERVKNSAPLQLLLATILEESAKIDEAIVIYEAMYKAEPRSPVIANNLASMLSEHKNNPDSLERAYEIAYSRFRNSNTPHFLDTLGWIYVLRGEFDEAVPFLKKASESLPNNGMVHFHLGMAYKGQERPELALASLKKAESLMVGKDFHRKSMLQKSLQELSEISK